MHQIMLTKSPRSDRTRLKVTFRSRSIGDITRYGTWTKTPLNIIRRNVKQKLRGSHPRSPKVIAREPSNVRACAVNWFTSKTDLMSKQDIFSVASAQNCYYKKCDAIENNCSSRVFSMFLRCLVVLRLIFKRVSCFQNVLARQGRIQGLIKRSPSMVRKSEQGGG